MDAKIIAERKANLDNFIKDSYPVIVDLAERFNFPNPNRVLQDNDHMSYFLGAIDDFMRHEEVDKETHTWITVRLGYVLGEFFIQKYSGYWGVNENTDSPQFGHYVVFAISPSNEHKAYPIDPFVIADTFVSQDPERDLVALIDKVEQIIE